MKRFSNGQGVSQTSRSCVNVLRIQLNSGCTYFWLFHNECMIETMKVLNTFTSNSIIKDLVKVAYIHAKAMLTFLSRNCFL